MNKRRLIDHPLLRLLVLAVLSIPLLLMLSTPRQKAPRPDELQQRVEQQVSEPDSYMTQLHLKHFTASGSVQYEFRARRASRQADTQVTILNEPNMLFLDTPDPWATDSNFGKLIGTGEVVELWDSVHIRRQDGSLSILTSAITLYPERDYAETDRPVTMDNDGSHTEGIGLEAYMKEKRMRLLSEVRSIHEPKRF